MMLIDLFKKPAPKRHISPKIRAYGKARIDIARRANNLAEWDQLWKKPANPFPFDWGERWKQCVEYKVDDFAAEVGFYTDILGLPVNAFDPDYAMFTSPGGDFYLAVVPASERSQSTGPEAIRIQFMVADLLKTTKELESRGISFEQKPQPCSPGSSMCIACFRTPHGISIDLWGLVDPSLLEPDKEVVDHLDEFSVDFEVYSPGAEPGFEDLSEPGRIEEEMYFLVEPDNFIETTIDQDKTSRQANWMAKRNLAIEPQPSIEEDQQDYISESEAEKEEEPGQSSNKDQFRFFEDTRLEENEEVEDESEGDFGENFEGDSDEDSDGDGALYEYTYEDDF